MTWKRPVARLAALPVLLAIACISLRPGTADETCASPETIVAQLRHDRPDVEVQLIDGPAAARIDAGIARLIGQKVPEGGTYLLARLPRAPLAYVVRVANGCATHHGQFPERLVRAWVLGSPA